MGKILPVLVYVLKLIFPEAGSLMYMSERDPDEKLLALDTCYLLHLVILSERSDFSVVGDGISGLFEAVLGFLLLQNLDESCLAIVAEL